MSFHEIALEIIRNKTSLVFAGGGVLGTCYPDALIRLSELGLDLKKIKSVSGCSVGSIMATTLACGASLEYMKNKLNSINFTVLMNKKCVLVQAVNLLKDYGLHDMSEVRNFIKSILTDLGYKTDITFKELYDKTGIWLTITYLSLNCGRTLFADHIFEPDSSVVETVIKSSAIPIFYEAHFGGCGKNTQVAVDGGTYELYPYRVEANKKIDSREILGLKFVSSNDKDFIDEGQPPSAEELVSGPTNIINYLESLFMILRKQALKVHVSKTDWLNTVKINIGTLTSTDFNITSEQKEWLFQQGKIAIDNYVDELANLLATGQYIYFENI